MRTRIILAVLLLVIITTIPAAAQVPPLINYQGKLTDINGVPLQNAPANPADGQIDITFFMWDMPAGGNLIWGPETHIDVPVNNGLFSVLLGNTGTVAPLDVNVFPPSPVVTRWLEVQVNDFVNPIQTLAPRKEIVSVAYASRADDADTIDGQDANALLNRANHIGTQTPGTINPQGAGSGLDADTVDGLDANQIGVTNHGALTGLGADDHTHYLTQTRHANIDTNLGEEAPTATERGEPTGQEIQNWADDITAWGHTNVVTDLNADRVDGLEASALRNRAAHTGVQTPATILPQGAGSGLNADMVDGQHANQLGVGGITTYDSGWFYVTNNSSYTLTHNLGTTGMLVKVYFSTNTSGSDMFDVMTYSHYDTLAEGGAQVQNIGTNTFIIRTGSGLVTYKFDPTAGWGRIEYRSGYYRVIAIGLP